MENIDFDDIGLKINLGQMFNSKIGQLFIEFIKLKLEQERRWLEKDIPDWQTYNVRGRVKALRSILNYINHCIEVYITETEETLNQKKVETLKGGKV